MLLQSDSRENRAQAFAALAYLCAAVAIELRFLVLYSVQMVEGKFGRVPVLPAVLFLLVAAFVGAYVHLLVDPSLKRRGKVLVAVANCGVLSLVVYYLLSVQG
ncbi:MAG TPA: hypothetical protein VH744_06855, partial [Terriglobales bacterium]